MTFHSAQADSQREEPLSQMNDLLRAMSNLVQQNTFLMQQAQQNNTRDFHILPDLSKSIQVFDGEKGPNEAKAWLSQLEITASVHRWPDAFTFETVSCHLEGAAKSWFKGRRSDIRDWDQFKAAFKKTFVREMSKDEAWKKMKDRRQEQYESTAAYYHDKVRLCRPLALFFREIKEQVAAGLRWRDMFLYISAARPPKLASAEDKGPPPPVDPLDALALTDMRVRKAEKEVLRDEPMWVESPYSGTRALHRLYSQNMDFSTFPVLVEGVYSDLESVNPRLRREMPQCLFQHVMTSTLNAVVIDHVRTVNAEERFQEEESPLNIIPEDMMIPQPIAEYFESVSNSMSAQGDMVRVNIPDIGVPQPPIPAEDTLQRIPSGSFDRITAQDHNKYECYASPLITARRIEETVLRNTERRGHDPDYWQPLPHGAYPRNGRPTMNLIGYRSDIERLNPEGVNALMGLDIPDDSSMAGRIKWSSRAAIRVTGTLKSLEGRYRMTIGRPRYKVNPSANGWIRVDMGTDPNQPDELARIAAMRGSVHCSSSLGNSQAYKVGCFGLKRERTQAANSNGKV